jgi:hypothetical protein
LNTGNGGNLEGMTGTIHLLGGWKLKPSAPRSFALKDQDVRQWWLTPQDSDLADQNEKNEMRFFLQFSSGQTYGSLAVLTDWVAIGMWRGRYRLFVDGDGAKGQIECKTRAE